MKWIILTIFYLYRTLSLQKELRMLQLQHYQLDRFYKYIYQSGQDGQYIMQRLIVHSPFLLLLMNINKQVELFALLLAVYFYITCKMMQSDQHKIQLHYTKRIVRLYLMLFLLYAIGFTFCYKSNYFLYGVLIMMSMNKLFVLVANICLQPIEKVIQNRYIMEAKKIIREHSYLQRIGIVGSYGKTSTKNIVYALLSNQFYTLKSKSSYNNMMGNTITIRKHLKQIHEILICEMGSDHVGELKKLMQFIQPQYLILTSIGNQHLETFKTQENIIQEKTSPLLYMKKEDIAFMNIDNPYLYQNKNKGICKKIYFGEHVEAQYRLHDIKMNEKGSTFSITNEKETITFTTSLLGYYNIMNIVGSIALAHTIDVSFTQIQQQLTHLQSIEHRLQLIPKEKYTLIDNAYNSNELSFKNSLSILSKMDQYKIFITPGLIDLKEDDIINEKIMNDIVGCVDEVVLVGYKNRKAMIQGLKNNHFNAYRIVDTMEEALHYADSLQRTNYIVFIENDIPKDFMNAKK